MEAVAGRQGDVSELVAAAYLIATVLFVCGLVVRDVYELLKLRGLVDTTNTWVFAAVFTSMCVMWVSWFAVGALSPVRLHVLPIVRWSGLGAVVLGAVLAVGGMWQLRGVENIDYLVTTGLFARVRHPMYVGFALWILGWCAFEGSVTNLILAPLGLASVLWWRHLEELDLAARYGDTYAEYKTLTWV